MPESAVGDDKESVAGIGATKPAAGSRVLYPRTRAIELRLPADFNAADAPRLLWQVRHAGFNAILLNCFTGGLTLHPSPTMRGYGFPEQDPRYRGRNPAVAVLSAARQEGLIVYALMDGLYVGDGRRGRNPILRRRPEWRVQGRDPANGPDSPMFLCPVNRSVQRFLGDLSYEILERYGFRGLYLRHLHFPLEGTDRRADYCRCDYCWEAAWRALGVTMNEIPDDPDHPDRYNLDAWRAKQLAEFLRYLRLRGTKAWAGPLIIIEVFLDADAVSPERCGLQDPCAWADEQLLPMVTFRPTPATPEDDEQWIARVGVMARCSLAMPVLSARPETPLARILDRFAVEPVAGFVVSAPHDLTAPPLNQLANGPFREPTAVAEDRPLRSVQALLIRTQEALPPDDALRAFLMDVLRVVEPLGENWPAAQRQALYENLQGLEEQIGDQKLSLGDAAPVVLRNFRLARQLLQLAEIEP